MKNNISYEYAEALFLLSCEDNLEEQYLKDLRLVKSAFDSEPEYLMLFVSPSITLEEKLSAIDSVFDGRINESVISFLKLLCENNRMDMLYACFYDYEKLYNQIKSITVASVVSAISLTEEEKARIKAKLEKKFGHRVELKCSVDEKILGGLIIKTEDTVIDGSLNRKMRDIKEVISSEPKT